MTGLKNVYRRSDIINMMINEPDKYKARSGEFLKRMRGRVIAFTGDFSYSNISRRVGNTA